MKRKLIQLGDSSIAVTLPNRWIKDNSLDKGDEVNLIISYNKLIIEPSIKQGEKITLDFRKKSPKFCWLALSTEYMKGIEHFEIIYDDKNRKEIIKIIDFLVGMVVIGEENNSLFVECISEPNQNLREQILNKLVLRMRFFVDKVIDSIISKGSYDDFKYEDHELNRLFFYSIRALRKNNQQDLNDTILLIQSFENIVDGLAQVVNGNIKSSDDKKILVSFKDLFKQVTDVYFNPSKKKNLILAYELADNLENKAKTFSLKYLFKNVKRNLNALMPLID